MSFWAVTHRHTSYVEAATEAEALEACADQVRDNADADDCTAEEVSEREYEQHWALVENGANAHALAEERSDDRQQRVVGAGLEDRHEV